jgi:hypothetical protein
MTNQADSDDGSQAGADFQIGGSPLCFISRLKRFVSQLKQRELQAAGQEHHEQNNKDDAADAHSAARSVGIVAAAPAED